MAQREPESGSDAPWLRREERREDRLRYLGRHPRTRVADANQDAAVRGDTGRDLDLVLPRRSIRNRLRRVHEQAQEDLREPRLARLYFGRRAQVELERRTP